jgi:hypothetical protein
MAWDDPSPRTRSRPAVSRNAPQPGYGAEPISFGRLALRIVLAAAIGVFAIFFAKAGIAAWHGQAPHTDSLDTVLACAIGFAVAAVAWKYVMNRPVSRFWAYRNDRYDDFSDDLADKAVAIELVADLADAAVDIASDL